MVGEGEVIDWEAGTGWKGWWEHIIEDNRLLLLEGGWNGK